MRRLAMLGLMIVGAMGCDGGGEDPPGTDAGPPTGMDAGQASCGGCLDATGACVDGDVAEACGAGGASCAVCDGGEMCVDGLCEAPPSCSPATCAGCCDGDTCLDGDTNAACGSGGFLCQACAPGESCRDGFCELPCDESCAGCCDATGACQGGTDASACGSAGASCEACGAGESCSLGACVPDSCASTCGGCCSGDTCLGGESSTACGLDGLACVDCGPNRVCDGGACAVSDTSRWDVIVVSGVVPERNAAGRPWDSFGGLPDPRVDAWAASSDSADPAATGSSMTDRDDTTPYWNDIVLSDVAARQLRYLRFTILDDDLAGDDVISVCRLRPTDADFSDTRLTLTCPREMAMGSQPATVAAALVVRIRPH